jgi:hypothetical protein
MADRGGTHSWDGTRNGRASNILPALRVPERSVLAGVLTPGTGKWPVDLLRTELAAEEGCKKLTYEAGFALEVETRSDWDYGMWLQPLVLDARVLTARHGCYAVAGRLIHVAEAGVRGILEGAGYIVEVKKEEGNPQLEEAA